MTSTDDRFADLAERYGYDTERLRVLVDDLTNGTGKTVAEALEMIEDVGRIAHSHGRGVDGLLEVMASLGDEIRKKRGAAARREHPHASKAARKFRRLSRW